MHLFPATYVTHSNRIGSQRIVFEVDDSNAELLDGLTTMPLGKNVVVLVYSVTEGVDTLQSLQEDDGARKLLLKKVHAKIGEYSTSTSVKSEHIKKVLKARMKMRNVDKSSFSDYTEHELADAVFVLDVELNPNRFNWTEHV